LTHIVNFYCFNYISKKNIDRSKNKMGIFEKIMNSEVAAGEQSERAH
jgi:hypothetical protein